MIFLEKYIFNETVVTPYPNLCYDRKQKQYFYNSGNVTDI